MSDPELYQWLALGRVDGGRAAKAAGLYLDKERPTPEHLTDVFDRLIWDGLVTVAEGDYLWDLRRMSLTEAGTARYAELCEQRQAAAPGVPDPKFGTQTPTGRELSGPPPAADHRAAPCGRSAPT